MSLLIADEKASAVHVRLTRDPRFEPVGSDPSDAALFRDHDLASLVENRCGEAIPPSSLDDAARSAWMARVSTSTSELGLPSSSYVRGYWLRDGAARVGTLALWTASMSSETLHISSLYVPPALRRRGYARRALRAVHDATIAEGLDGIRLETDWCWQPAVRFYLSIGMWIRMWKRDLVFVLGRDLASWRAVFDGDVARMVVGTDERVLIEARRLGERLEWRETPEMTSGADSEVRWLARGTFAVALATRGWPLLTSEDAWRKQLEQGFSDCGGPEGLAFKIRGFEAWSRKNGWRVDTPRIPGLDYPDWDALHAGSRER